MLSVVWWPILHQHYADYIFWSFDVTEQCCINQNCLWTDSIKPSLCDFLASKGPPFQTYNPQLSWSDAVETTAFPRTWLILFAVCCTGVLIWASSRDYGTYRHINSSSNTHAQQSTDAKRLIFVRPFVYFHTLCVRTADAQSRLSLRCSPMR